MAEPRRLPPAGSPLRVVVSLQAENYFHQQCPLDLLINTARRHAVDLVIAENDDALRDATAGAAVLMAGEIPRGLIQGAPDLVWIHTLAAGVEKILWPEVVASDVIVTNSAGTMAPEVAEHIIALVLAMTRRVDRAIRLQSSGRWHPIRRDHPPIGLAGLTVAIIGYGHIGRAIAERMRAFGTKLIGVRRSAGLADGLVDRVAGLEELPAVLAGADIVVVALPQAETTHNLFGRAAFEAMKETSVFVNVGRGAVVDETALRLALEQGAIAGAALDVFVEEPLPPTSPLWRAPNLIITPHLAGGSQNVWGRVIDLAFANLERLRHGERPLNLIEKPPTARKDV